MRRPVALALALLLPFSGSVTAQARDEVTIYRCIDGKGHVTLGDKPCAAGSKEEMRTMQRPQDAPAQPAPPAPAAAAATTAAAAPPPQVILMRTPQSMYECTTPEGTQYTSDNGDGNPRWVPLWTSGYGRRTGDASRGAMRPAQSIWQNVGAPSPSRPPTAFGSPRPPGHTPPRHGYAQGGGTWVRDSCHLLPPAEVCSRLRDRREEIRRRFFNAQESERSTLRPEERALNARLQADCG